VTVGVGGMIVTAGSREVITTVSVATGVAVTGVGVGSVRLNQPQPLRKKVRVSNIKSTNDSRRAMMVSFPASSVR
jgi:hypothetical protein